MAAGIKSVRDGHAAWDRKKREFNNIVEKSRRNQHTADSKPQKDLEEFVVSCDKLAAGLIAMETKLSVGDISKQGITEIDEFATDLYTKTKEAQKKAKALSAWFRL